MGQQNEMIEKREWVFNGRIYGKSIVADMPWTRMVSRTGVLLIQVPPIRLTAQVLGCAVLVSERWGLAEASLLGCCNHFMAQGARRDSQHPRGPWR